MSADLRGLIVPERIRQKTPAYALHPMVPCCFLTKKELTSLSPLSACMSWHLGGTFAESPSLLSSQVFRASKGNGHDGDCNCLEGPENLLMNVLVNL